MTEVIIYMARAMVVVIVYTTSRVGMVVINSTTKGQEHPKLDRICPAKIRKAMLDAFAEVAEISVAVVGLHWIGVL